MKLLKIAGWCILGVLFLSVLAYGFFPILVSTMITRSLANHGFESVKIIIDYPGPRRLIIPALSFRTSSKSSSPFIQVNHLELSYSLDSLLHNAVDTVKIGHVNIVWSDHVSETPAWGSEPQIDLSWLGSGSIIPSLPFRHLHIAQMEISNPQAPQALQHSSMTASIDSLAHGYKGTIYLHGESLPFKLLTFSFEKNGIVSLEGRPTHVQEDPVLHLETSLDTSTDSLVLNGQTTFNLHSLIQLAAALYPISSEFHEVTGTMSGTWTGVVHRTPRQSDSALGPIQGAFEIDAHMPVWASFAQEIQLFVQGTFAVDERNVTLILQPSSGGTLNLGLKTVIPPLLDMIIAYEGLRSFSWNIPQPVHLIFPFDKQDLSTLKMSKGQIHINMRNPSEHLDILLAPQNLQWEPSGGIHGKAAVTGTIHLKPVSTPSLRMEALSLHIETSLLSSADHLTATLTPSSFFRLTNIQHALVQIPAVEGRFPSGLDLTSRTKQQTWELQTPASILSLPSLSLQGQQWELQEIFTKNLALTFQSSGWVISGTTEVKNLVTRSDGLHIPTSTWQTRYSATPSLVNMHFRGQSLDHPLQVGGQVRLDLEADEGWGTITLNPVTFAPQTLPLSHLIRPWPFPDMDVTHGTISASAELTFGTSPTMPFQLTRLHGIVDMNELEGFVKPTIVQGLTTHIEILGEEDIFRITRTPVHIPQIQSVVDLTDTSFIFSSGTFNQAQIPLISVTNLSTHLLGGQVILEKAVYDPAQPEQEVTLQVEGLALGDILRLEQQEAVKGTGTLDGVLPLLITGSDVEVHQGSLHARPPGGTLEITISEDTARNWTKSQPNLDLILQSLQNFQYSKLQIGVDYEKTGILKLATRLEGNNPEYRKGVPIHFNLNIEENIPALMKSLSLVQGLEDHIKNMMTGTKKLPVKGKN